MRGLVAAVVLVAATGAAQSAVVYRNVIGGGDVVEFHDTKPQWCPHGGLDAGATQAVWRVNAGPRKGEVVQGCWLERGGVVLMAFKDGDHYAVPLEKIRELHERGGA